MKIKLLCIGKTKEKWINTGIQHYSERVKHFCSFSIDYLKDKKTSDSDHKKSADGEAILSAVDSSDFLILLDEKGKEMTSVEFSEFLSHPALTTKKNIIFVIGGAYGFSSEVYDRADRKISLSLMTFPHDLIRVMFTEQLYRAYSILNHKNYHHI